MSLKGSTRTRVLLSFSRVYSEFARRIAGDLGAVNIEVQYDQWEGGGGTPAFQSVAVGVDDVSFVLPVLTPSEAAPTWIGDEWRRAIYEKAMARGVNVLPLRGEGDLGAIPEFLRDRSFADLRGQRYGHELLRLIETIRDQSGDADITRPDGFREGETGNALTLPPNPLVLEIGVDLAPLFEGDEGSRRFVDEMVPMMCDGLFYSMGVKFPEPLVRITSDVPPSSARIVINDVPETQFEIRPGFVLVNERVRTLVEGKFTPEPAVNPASGADCAWIPIGQAAAAEESGLTTWDALSYLVLTLSSVLRNKAADFVGMEETRAMLAQIEPVFPQLVAETVPKTVSLFVLTDVVRRLVAELVSIRDLRRILMALVAAGRFEQDPLMLTEYARIALRRQITHSLSRGTGTLVVFLLHPDIESSIRQSTRRTATGTYVDLAPDGLRKILNAIRSPLVKLPKDAQVPQILTTMDIRSAIRRLVATSMPRLHVVSYDELRPDAMFQPVGRIALDGFSVRPGVTVGGEPVWGDDVPAFDEGGHPRR